MQIPKFNTVQEMIKIFSKLKYTFVISEKYDSAKKIAMFLGAKGFYEITLKKEKFFFAQTYSNENYIIFYSNGHLYNLEFRSVNKIFPIFNPKWHPKDKEGKTTRRIKLIELFSKKAEKFIHACDYDQEGELIGYNVLHYACGSKYGRSFRAKYSSLTKQEIIKSFSPLNLSKPNKNLVESGKIRHLLDFIYGINLSKIMYSYFNNTHNHKAKSIISIGRVQTPTLSFVVDKEIEIRKHIPDPYWKIMLELQTDKLLKLHATYEIEKINKNEASRIIKDCEGKNGIIKNIQKKDQIVDAYPFNLRELQTEGFRIYGYSPSETLGIAEKLYLSGLISYPRTESQEYPYDLDFKTIFNELVKSKMVDSLLVSNILNKNFIKVNKGRKTDSAHPAIYPTGSKYNINELEKKDLQIYDLIIKRFVATFFEPLIVTDFKIYIIVKNNLFVSTYKTTKNHGWTSFYPFKTHENKIPELKVGEKLINLKIEKVEKFSISPIRFHATSLLAKMDSKKIGTKSTRSGIIDLLVKRKYIAYAKGGYLKPTELGICIIALMREYVPKIISVNMTREMEKQLMDVEMGKNNGDLLIEKIKKDVNDSISILIKERKKIVNEIKQNYFMISNNSNITKIKN